MQIELGAGGVCLPQVRRVQACLLCDAACCVALQAWASGCCKLGSLHSVTSAVPARAGTGGRLQHSRVECVIHLQRRQPLGMGAYCIPWPQPTLWVLLCSMAPAPPTHAFPGRCLADTAWPPSFFLVCLFCLCFSPFPSQGIGSSVMATYMGCSMAGKSPGLHVSMQKPQTRLLSVVKHLLGRKAEPTRSSRLHITSKAAHCAGLPHTGTVVQTSWKLFWSYRF